MTQRYRKTKKRNTITSVNDGIITITASQKSQRYKLGDSVIVVVSHKAPSAFTKRRKVSEIVAQGLVQNTAPLEISINSNSPIVSDNAALTLTRAINQKCPVIIKALKKYHY